MSTPNLAYAIPLLVATCDDCAPQETPPPPQAHVSAASPEFNCETYQPPAGAFVNPNLRQCDHPDATTIVYLPDRHLDQEGGDNQLASIVQDVNYRVIQDLLQRHGAVDLIPEGIAAECVAMNTLTDDCTQIERTVNGVQPTMERVLANDSERVRIHPPQAGEDLLARYRLKDDMQIAAQVLGAPQELTCPSDFSLAVAHGALAAGATEPEFENCYCDYWGRVYGGYFDSIKLTQKAGEDEVRAAVQVEAPFVVDLSGKNHQPFARAAAKDAGLNFIVVEAKRAPLQATFVLPDTFADQAYRDTCVDRSSSTSSSLDDTTALEQALVTHAPDYMRTVYERYDIDCSDVRWVTFAGLPKNPNITDTPSHFFMLETPYCDPKLPICTWNVLEYEEGLHVNGFTVGGVCLTPSFSQPEKSEEFSKALELDALVENRTILPPQ